MKSKADILAALDEIIEAGGKLPFGGYGFVPQQATADAQYWLARTVSVLQTFLPASSYHFTEAVRMAGHAHRQGGIIRVDVDALRGHLRFLRDAVAEGSLSNIENELRSADFATFLQHAREYLLADKKMEASVIAAAVFEDTIKRLGVAYNIADLSKLDSTISSLRNVGAISSIEAKQFRYLSGIRNAALHAAWDEFDLDAVRHLIDGVDRLLVVLAEAP